MSPPVAPKKNIEGMAIRKLIKRDFLAADSRSKSRFPLPIFEIDGCVKIDAAPKAKKKNQSNRSGSRLELLKIRIISREKNNRTVEADTKMNQPINSINLFVRLSIEYVLLIEEIGITLTVYMEYMINSFIKIENFNISSFDERTVNSIGIRNLRNDS